MLKIKGTRTCPYSSRSVCTTLPHLTTAEMEKCQSQQEVLVSEGGLLSEGGRGREVLVSANGT